MKQWNFNAKIDNVTDNELIGIHNSKNRQKIDEHLSNFNLTLDSSKLVAKVDYEIDVEMRSYGIHGMRAMVLTDEVRFQGQCQLVSDQEQREEYRVEFILTFDQQVSKISGQNGSFILTGFEFLEVAVGKIYFSHLDGLVVELNCKLLTLI